MYGVYHCHVGKEPGSLGSRLPHHTLCQFIGYHINLVLWLFVFMWSHCQNWMFHCLDNTWPTKQRLTSSLSDVKMLMYVHNCHSLDSQCSPNMIQTSLTTVVIHTCHCVVDNILMCTYNNDFVFSNGNEFDGCCFG